jgi:hypothetical protein
MAHRSPNFANPTSPPPHTRQCSVFSGKANILKLKMKDNLVPIILTLAWTVKLLTTVFVYTANTLYQKFETNIPRNETARPYT